ncbi:DUF177 domain-containing protein [Vallitalea pronyensis]|uniref:DUF177 domain-containing protein n=1 Tax=Vallitalea pronyensis TaxID=1348613 RepID=A0A8J8SGN1_9FIRM|nr:DUF177 domain-containing protein [Vallitalea pronyensis]QUI22945.1 DUF177 domain-containing protein [Vallitalea pronyensis]
MRVNFPNIKYIWGEVMHINLTDFLFDHETNRELSSDLGVKQLTLGGNKIQVEDVLHLDLQMTNLGEKKIHLEGCLTGTLMMPCDRCMDEVHYTFETDFSKDVQLDDPDIYYVEGHHLDLEKLALSELIIELPMKVLCSETCKGICNQCGVNLNQETCSCDRSDIDPRLAVFKDLMKEF